MRKIYLVLFAMISMVLSVTAQTTYYSVPAATDPNVLTNWNSNRDGISGTTPANFTTGDVFVLQGTGNGAGTPVSMTTTAAWGISGAASKLQIENGATLTAAHIITLAAATTFQIDNGGSYNQNVTMSMGSTIFQGTEAFAPSSNIAINAIPGGTSLPSGAGYGNLTINTPTNAGNFGWGNTIVTIQGNLTVISTGTGVNEQRLSAGTASNVTVGGDLSIQGGVFVLSSGAAASTLTVAGTSTISGGNLVLSGGSGNTTFSPNGGFTQSGGTLTLSTSTGNGVAAINSSFNQTSGTITRTSSTASAVNFTGTALQNVNLSGTTTSNVNFGISNPVGISLAGTMTINQGASLTIATTATDPVQGAGTISYLGALANVGVMANLRFAALAGTTFTGGAQTITDKLWPVTNAPNALFIDNTSTAPNNKVTSALTADRTLIGGATSLNQLTITNGIFDIANSSIALGLNAAYAISSPNNTKMIVTPGTGFFKLYMPAAGFSNVVFPVGDISGTADYSEMYFLYSTAASAASFIGVKVRNAIISGDAPGTDFAARNWEMTQETVAAGLPSGTPFVSSPAYTMQINGRGPTTDVTGTITNMRLFKNVSGVYSQINSGSSLSAPNYNSGNAFFTGTFPAISETSVNGYIYAPRTYLGQQTYTWNGSVSSDYQVPGNWTPTRSVLDVADVLIFDGTITPTASVTNLASETVGRLVFRNNVQATLAGTNGLTTGGGTATGTVDVLNIAAGSRLTWSSTAALSLSGPATATTRTATIDGTIETAATGAITISSSNTPTVTFSATGVFNYLNSAGSGITNSGGAAFLIWSAGATLNHLRVGGGTILPTGTYNTGSNVNVGTSGTPVTSLSFSPPVLFGSNVTMYVNLSFVSSISLAGATTFDGTWNIISSGAGRVRFSGSAVNTWTFNKQVTVTSTNPVSGIELSTQSGVGPTTWYTFGNATTPAPCLNITGGVLAQQATTGTTAAFTTVAINNGLTIGNNGSIVANSNAGAVTTGDFIVNINKGDLSFGTGTTMTGTVSSSATTTSKLQLTFTATGDQTFTPAVTTTGRTQISVSKGSGGTSGNVILSTRNLTTNAIILSSGKLVANALNILVNPVGTGTNSGVANGSKTANSWIAFTTGKLTVNLIGTAGKRFPVGTGIGANDYAGLQIFGASGTNNVAGANNITVGVQPGVLLNVSNPERQIQYTWDIARSNTGIAIDVDFNYDDVKAGAGCTPTANMNVSRHDGTNWGLAAGTTVSNLAPVVSSQGADRVVSAFGISATSPFVIGNVTASSIIGVTESGVNQTYAIINTGAGNTFYDLFAATVNPDFQGANLGTFNACAGTLVLNGGQNKVYKCTNGDITANRIYYRVYKVGDVPGSFSNIAIGFLSETNNGCGGRDQTWETNNAGINLLSGITSTGNYVLEVYSEANYNNNGIPGVWTANNNGPNYSANFTVSDVPATVAAGPNQTICGINTATLAGSFGGGATSATWTSSGTGTFNDATLNNAVYTPSGADIAAGSVTLTRTTNDPAGACPAVNASMTLTLIAAPTADAGGNQTICAGNTFTVSGATATNNTGVSWATAGDGTFINGTTLTPTYTPGLADLAGGSVLLTLTATGNSPCANALNIITLTITNTGALAGAVGGPQVCQTKNIGIGATFNDNSCNTIATVVPAALGGGTPVTGSVTGCVKVESSIPQYGSTYYVARHYDIEPATAPATSSAFVTLYFSPAEMAAFNSDPGAIATHFPLPVAPGDNTDSVRIEQYHGTGTNPTNYTGALEVWSTANGLTITFSNGYWAITVPATSFSGFWLTSKVRTPLPVNVEYFRGSKQGDNHRLDWKVTCTNTQYAILTIEASTNGRTFSSIYSIRETAVRCQQPFSFTNARPAAGLNYYRLKMTDDNGIVTYSSIVALLNKTTGFEIVNVTPNPVTEGRFKLNITTTAQQKMEVLVADMTGRVVSRKTIALTAGFNAVDMTVNQLSNGTYQVYGITDGQKTKTLTFVKQ